MDKATQRAKILNYCKQNGSITVRDACVKLDINSPTKRFSEMRKSDRYDVRIVVETKIKDDGNVARYNRYYISEVSQ